MNSPENICLSVVPCLGKAKSQITRIEKALATADYDSLGVLLQQQVIILHSIGVDFVERSAKSNHFRYQKACIEISLKCFAQSQRTAEAIKK